MNLYHVYKYIFDLLNHLVQQFTCGGQVFISTARSLLLLLFHFLHGLFSSPYIFSCDVLNAIHKLQAPLCNGISTGMVLCESSSPAGLPLCHSETPAWTRPPPWMSYTRRIPRPPASVGAVTGRPAAVRRRSTDTCRLPTWMDPPTLLVCRTAAGVSGRREEVLKFF